MDADGVADELLLLPGDCKHRTVPTLVHDLAGLGCSVAEVRTVQRLVAMSQPRFETLILNNVTYYGYAGSGRTGYL